VPPASAAELAWCQLSLLDYIAAHDDDSSELIDELKPRLERIIRGES